MQHEGKLQLYCGFAETYKCLTEETRVWFCNRCSVCVLWCVVVYIVCVKNNFCDLLIFGKNKKDPDIIEHHVDQEPQLDSFISETLVGVSTFRYLTHLYT